MLCYYCAYARFNADTSATMRWKFRPQQTEVLLVPGETSLAFYTATNPTNEAIVGISTYNVLPFEVRSGPRLCPFFATVGPPAGAPFD